MNEDRFFSVDYEKSSKSKAAYFTFALFYRQPTSTRLNVTL